MQIVEVTGIPGSGKTTFVGELCLFFEENDITYILGKDISFSLFTALQTLIIFCFKNPKATVTVISALYLRLHRGMFQDFFLTSRRFIRMITQYRIAQSLSGEGYVIFDEGYIHRAQSLFVFDGRFDLSSYTETYLSQMPKVSLVLFLVVDRSVAYNRVVQRGVPVRWRFYKKNEIEKAMSQSATVDSIARNFVQNKNIFHLINPKIDSRILSFVKQS